MLAAVSRDYRGQLRADMRRFYGMGWADARSLPLTEVADMVAHLPPESAVMRAANPHPDRSLTLDLLQLVEHGVRVLAWQQTADATKGRNYPKYVRLPWDEPERVWSSDALSFDEDFGDARMRAALDRVLAQLN